MTYYKAFLQERKKTSYLEHHPRGDYKNLLKCGQKTYETNSSYRDKQNEGQQQGYQTSDEVLRKKKKSEESINVLVHL